MNWYIFLAIFLHRDLNFDIAKLGKHALHLCGNVSVSVIGNDRSFS